MDKYFLGKTTEVELYYKLEKERYWTVNYGTENNYEIVDRYRAKSRSRLEMQILLDHMNKKLETVA